MNVVAKVVVVLLMLLAGLVVLPGSTPSGALRGGLPYGVVAPAVARDGPTDAVEVRGRVLAGPTCPVERIPPDPRCADRPVSGAVLLFVDRLGRDAGRAVSDDNGAFTILLPVGRYTLWPQPVVGLLGTAPPQDVTVTADAPPLVVLYDTGIR
jgi:hypothetical protein